MSKTVAHISTLKFTLFVSKTLALNGQMDKAIIFFCFHVILDKNWDFSGDKSCKREHFLTHKSDVAENGGKDGGHETAHKAGFRL